MDFITSTCIFLAIYNHFHGYTWPQG
jgi:hypothetical protein